MREKCWHCGRKLATDFKNGGLHFAEVEDLDGNKLKTHKGACKTAAEQYFRPKNMGEKDIVPKNYGDQNA